MSENLNYERWEKDHVSILKDLKNKHVLVTFSGGKDSSLVLEFIRQAADAYRFGFEAHAVVFPAYVLSEEEIERLDRYWLERDVRIVWHRVPVADEKLKEALDNHIVPCMVCNQTKKEVLVNFFKEARLPLDQTVLIVNYSLWDLVSATVEHLLGGVYRDGSKLDKFKGKTSRERFLETSQRFYPLLRVHHGLTIFKPLIRYNDQDIMRAVQSYGIPVTERTCQFHEHRPKRWFAKYYHAVGLEFDYNRVLDFAKGSLHLPEKSFFERIDLNQYLKAVF